MYKKFDILIAEVEADPVMAPKLQEAREWVKTLDWSEIVTGEVIITERGLEFIDHDRGNQD